MKKVRKFLATALAVAMSMSMAIPAFAAEATPDVVEQQAVVAESPASIGNGGNEGIMPLSTSYPMVGNSYKTIATNSNGINGDLHISVTGKVDFDGASYQLNVLMFDKSGNVVWRGDNVAGWPGTSCTLWCGSNVTRVDLQIAPRFAWVQPNTFEVKVTY